MKRFQEKCEAVFRFGDAMDKLFGHPDLSPT
jgi:hypothetical protein